MLRKGVYPHKYIDNWKRFDKTSLPKKYFHGNLNMEDITDADYKHTKIVWKDFQIKDLREYHDLYVLKCYVITCRCI